jgi:hypothetical protein
VTLVKRLAPSTGTMSNMKEKHNDTPDVRTTMWFSGPEHPEEAAVTLDTQKEPWTRMVYAPSPCGRPREAAVTLVKRLAPSTATMSTSRALASDTSVRTSYVCSPHNTQTHARE